MADDRPSEACYVAEVFAPLRNPEQQRAEADHVRAAAEALARTGVRVGYVESLFVPGEETAFFLFEADRPAEVERVLHDAGLEAERISVATAIRRRELTTRRATARPRRRSGGGDR
jgi:hypothetical protein